MTDASEQAAYDAQIVSDASSYKLFKLFTAAACSLSLRCPETLILRARNEVETANLIPAFGKTDLQKNVSYGMPILRVYVGLGRAKTKKPVKQEPDRPVIQTRQPV